MQKATACILMMAGALVACGKDKHQEPAMAPAAGEQWEQRQQTAPAYTEEPAQAPQQQGEWQPEAPPPEETWGMPAQAQAAGNDARMLAEARCGRELRCNNVGAGKSHASMEDCQASLLSEGEELFSTCSNPVAREALATCLTSIQAMGCDNTMSDLNQVAACRSTALCAP